MDFYLLSLFKFVIKYPLALVIYTVDITTINIDNVFICFTLYFSIYGWLKYTSNMTKCLKDIYIELKSTTEAVTKEL